MEKDKTPLVSVVMPAYNSEKYISEAIESVLNQTFKDFEFIIVNDGSTDNTFNIIKEYARKDKRIKVINNKKNCGISKTRNNGIKLARGKYIATHDSDDISLPTRFQEQLSFMEQHPEVGVVGAYIQIFDSDSGKIIGIRKYSNEDKVLRKNIFFYSPIAQPVSMIRKEVFSEVGYYDNNYPPTEDLDLWFKIGTKYKFSNINKILLRYRVNSNSATSSRTKLMEKLTIRIRWKNQNNPSYHFGPLAFTYNSLHFLSLYLIPSKFKLWLFGKLRDNKK